MKLRTWTLSHKCVTQLRWPDVMRIAKSSSNWEFEVLNLKLQSDSFFILCYTYVLLLLLYYQMIYTCAVRSGQVWKSWTEGNMVTLGSGCTLVRVRYALFYFLVCIYTLYVVIAIPGRTMGTGEERPSR